MQFNRLKVVGPLLGAVGFSLSGGLAAQEAAGSFNPRISVILDGVYYTDDVDGMGDSLLGEAAGISHARADAEGHAHAHGGMEDGFYLRETEIAFSATVDPNFDASLYLAVSSAGEVELEEAFFETRQLPAGFKLKGGKFFSGIGYANSRHPHEWDFVDQNLAYRSLLGGHGLGDTGLQLTWLPAWDTYALFAMELLQGEQERLGRFDAPALAHELEAEARARAIDALLAAGTYDPLELAGELENIEATEATLDERKRGPQLVTLFAKVSPDLGDNHALQGGFSYAYANQHQEIHAHDEDLSALSGTSWLAGTDWVYRYDDPRAYGRGDWRVQAEYLYQVMDLDVAYHTDEAALGGSVKKIQDGAYLQASYGIAPRWQAGLRYDVTGLTNRVERSWTTNEVYDSSTRWSAALTFRASEFSLVRLQLSQADIATDDGNETFNTVYLQYQTSLGSHGAHRF